jgi:hypothetical protein
MGQGGARHFGRRSSPWRSSKWCWRRRTTPALGAQVDLGALEAGDVEALFSERSAIVFEVAPERSAALFQAARERSLLAWPIGTVGTRAELKVLRPQGNELLWSKEELSRVVARPLVALWNEEES